MRGKLTLDKAASNMSVFFKTIQIVANSPNGRISRKDFGNIMGEFIDIPSIKDGKENRTPYNKSKFPRYFGFIDKKSIDDTEYLEITKRGLRLNSLVSDKGENFVSGERYFISNDNIGHVQELFWQSILFDSFGRNNCGAEDSFTDVDPVKIIISSLIELKSCTIEELCFIIFGLNGGEDQNSHLFNSFEEAILKIKNSRYQKKIDFERQFVKWGKSNIVRDFKVLNILSDQNVKLLLKSDDLLSINEKFNSTYFKQIKSNYFLPYYQARNEKYSFSGNAKENNYWIRNIRLGNVLDENIFICEELISLQQQGNDEQKLGQLEEALIRSFNHPKTNVYYWIMDIRQEKLEETFGEIMTLFDRVNDFTNNFNGMSRQLLPKTNSLAVSIINRSARAKKKINELGGLRFPANFNILIQNSVYE